MKYKIPTALIAIIVASAALQISRIGTYSFWFDESYTSALLKYNFADVASLTGADVHPPLFYWTLKVWSSVFGSSDAALRSFSTLCMLVSLVLLFAFIKKLVNEKAALFATFIAAFGPFVIRYGQEARMYGMSSVFILGASLTLVEQMTRRPKDRNNRLWMLYGILIAAVLYTHYFGGVLVLAHALYVFYVTQASGLKQRLLAIDHSWVLALAGSFVLYIPWMPTLLAQFSAVNEGFWIPPVNALSFVGTISQLMAFEPIDNGSTNGYKIAGVIGFIATVGLVGLVWKKMWVPRQALILTIGSVVCLSISLYAVSALPFTSSYYYVRYFAQYAPLFYGGIGLLLYGLWKYGNRMVFVAAAGVIVTVQLFGVSHVLDGTDKRNNATNTVYRTIEENYQPGDFLLTEDFSTFYDLHHYNQTESKVFLAAPTQDYGSLEPIFQLPYQAVVFPEEVEAVSGRIWYLRNYSRGENVVQPNWRATGEEVQRADQVLQLYTVDSD